MLTKNQQVIFSVTFAKEKNKDVFILDGIEITKFINFHEAQILSDLLRENNDLSCRCIVFDI